MKVKVVKFADFWGEFIKEGGDVMRPKALEKVYNEYKVLASHELKGELYFVVEEKGK